MLRIWVGVLTIFISFSTALHSFGLDDPVACETCQPVRMSSDLTAFFMRDANGEVLCMAIDRGDYRAPLFLSLADPREQTALSTFLVECEKIIQKVDQEGGVRRIAIVQAGPFSRGQVREWYEKIAAERSKSVDPAPLAFFGHPLVQILTEEAYEAPHLLLSYTFDLPSPKTYRDIRKLWTIGLIQQMTLQKLMGEGMIASHACDTREFLLPVSSLQISLPFEGQNWKDSLQVGLQKIKEISEVGFTVDNLQEARREFLFLVQELQKEKSASPTSSNTAFLAQSFLRGLSSLSYAAFIDSATTLIESITPIDIAIVLHECFIPKQRTISYLGSEPLDQTWVAQAQQVIDSIEEGATQRVALMQTLMDAPQDLFEQLSLTDGEKTIIGEIIDTMARESVFQLLWKKKSMEKKGKKIRHVHPLRFLGHIFADQHLRHCMREIHRSTFKWNGFIEGMEPRIKQEAERGGLIPYIPGFARYIRRETNEQEIRGHIEHSEWGKLVEYLLKDNEAHQRKH